MKLIPEKGPWPRLLVFPLLTVAVFGLGLARFYPELTYRLAHCPFRDTTGIPCFTCGGTHSIVSFMQGQLAESFLANPLVLVGAILFGIWSFYALMATIKPRLRRSLVVTRQESKTVKILVGLLLVVNWIWLLGRYR